MYLAMAISIQHTSTTSTRYINDVCYEQTTTARHGCGKKPQREGSANNFIILFFFFFVIYAAQMKG